MYKIYRNHSHSFDAETVTYSNFINLAISKEKNLASNHLPLQTNIDLFQKCRDGLILYELINFVKPKHIPVDHIHIQSHENVPLSMFQKKTNIDVIIDAAAMLKCYSNKVTVDAIERGK
jgi:hypothetical protein